MLWDLTQVTDTYMRQLWSCDCICVTSLLTATSNYVRMIQLIMFVSDITPIGLFASSTIHKR
jgi:hypothetical protein